MGHDSHGQTCKYKSDEQRTYPNSKFIFRFVISDEIERMMNNNNNIG